MPLQKLRNPLLILEAKEFLRKYRERSLMGNKERDK